MKQTIAGKTKRIIVNAKSVRVVESVDTRDLKSLAPKTGRAGSSPATDTIHAFSMTSRKDVTIFWKDWQATVYTTSRHGFTWMKENYPTFGTVSFCLDDEREVEKLVEKMKKARLRVLVV